MNTTGEFLLSLVVGTRMALRIRDRLIRVLPESRSRRKAEALSAFLVKALFAFSGEKLRPDQDFPKDSETMKLLESSRTDEEAAEAFLALRNPSQPAPCTMERDAFLSLYRQNGGYMHGGVKK